jgi:glycosyltransferase involved in cell wall biosynthesis
VCHVIETDRCARCFRESPFHPQIAFGRVAAATRAPRLMQRAAVQVLRRFPRLAGRLRAAADHAPRFTVTSQDIEQRLADARNTFGDIDLFVAPSSSMASEFKRLGISAEKMRVSDYGFVPLLRAPRPVRRGPLRIGYVGTLVWHKGVHVLVEAVRGLRATDYELRVFGDTAVFPDYTAELEARAAGLPVRFMGPFDRDRVADVYAQIDVLVVPSLWLENSPLVIHEAFMAGIPVVGARMGGIVDLVEEGRTGLLYDATSPAQLETALRRLIEHPDEFQGLTALARTVPVKSIAQDAVEWEAAYADVLGRRASHGCPT